MTNDPGPIYLSIYLSREEMLIFMEYCPEGTLEALVTSTETGLEESMVRRYTRQLLQVYIFNYFYQSIFVSLYLFIYLSVCISVYLSIFISLYQKVLTAGQAATRPCAFIITPHFNIEFFYC